MTPVRLTVVLTHPIQYYAPWFRHITRHAPEIALTVVHATQPTPAQQGVGFDRAFTWDVPLTEGYESVTVRAAREGERIDSSHFMGLDVPEIGAAIARTRPDVVLITGWYSVTLVRALYAARRLGVPILYRGDSHLLSGPRDWRRILWTVKTWFLLRKFAGFLSPGKRVSEYLDWFTVPDYRIFKVPHGIDNEMFARHAAPFQEPSARAAARTAWGIDPAAFVVLFVGKLVPSKRPLNVVRAVARLGPGASLLVVGSGPLEADVRQESQQLGVDLKLVGFLNQTELGKAYAVADCLALPSDFPETWGLVVNEALATGLPVIVSAAVGCAPDLVEDGVTGYQYPLGHIDAMANRLETVRRRKAEGYDWRLACRATIDRFSYAEMTAGLVRACRSVLRHSVHVAASPPDASRRVLACCGQMVIAGGLERMTFRVLQALRARDASVHCIVNDWENFRITPLAEAAGATWSVGPYWHPLTRRRLTALKIAKMIWETLRVSADCLRQARRIRPTHVLLPDFQTVLRNTPALVWLRARGVHVVMRLGNAPEAGRFYRLLWRWLIDPFIDTFVCNSVFTQRELLSHDVAADKILVIANAPSDRGVAWRPDGDRMPGRVVFVGQIIPEKGLDCLLDAIALLRARGRAVTLDVVGDMDGWEAPGNVGYRAGLRARAARPDLAGAVDFLGWREDVPAIMARASVHCCPSLPQQREAFGNVVLEAKLSGLPSVVTPSGDLPDLVAHRENGWVCGEPTADAIAEGIAFFLDNPVRLVHAGRAAHESAREFSAEKFADAWVQVFA
jgi:glycosyltransferase involved in cell wall biosynthesis